MTTTAPVSLVSNFLLICAGEQPLTGSFVRCPKCKGHGSYDRYDDEGGYVAMCDACPVAGVIALPVEPETRDALGEELMLDSGLEWDELCGGRCACECWACSSERAE